MSNSLFGVSGVGLLLAMGWGTQVAMGDLFGDGLAGYRNSEFEQAAQLWQTADPGTSDPRLLFGLGLLYGEGKGVQMSATKAAEYFRLAAEKGYAPAQFNLGLAYYSGEGLEKSAAQAYSWWEQAAQQGYLPAQYNLASLLWDGAELDKDQASALHWFRQASLGGSPEAGDFLRSLLQGMALELEPDSGHAESENAELPPSIRGELAFEREQFERAYQIFLPLAEEGDRDAQYYVAYLLESGQGIQQDLKEAVKWYESAVAQGQAQAQYNLGMLYINGQGVEQNEGLGLYWIQSAADSNEARAKAYMDSLR